MTLIHTHLTAQPSSGLIRDTLKFMSIICALTALMIYFPELFNH